MESSQRRKIPYAKPIAIAAALLLIYVLFGFFAAPPILTRSALDDVDKTLQRKAKFGDVRVNPLLFTLEVRDFALTEKDGAPIAGFKRLFADFELSSILRAAWTFREISLEGLDLHADIAPDGRFNIAALLNSLPKTDKKPGDKLPRVLLHRLALVSGAFTFSDRAIAEPASAALKAIDLEVHELSTIPDSQGKYKVSVKLPEGGTLDWEGDATLQPLASQGRLALKGLKPVTAWRFLRQRVDLAEPQGEFDLGLDYRFRYAGGGAQLDLENLKAAGRGIALATNGDRNIALALASFEAASGPIAFSAAQGKPWQAKLDALKVTLADLDFSDRSRRTPYRALVKETTVAFNASAEALEAGPALLLDNIAVTQKGISAGQAASAQPLGTLDEIVLEGGKIDLAERLLSVGKLTIAGGELRVERDKDGDIALLKILAPSDEGLLRREIGGAAKEAKAKGKPWRTALEELQVNGMRVAVSDRSFGEPIAYDVRDLRLALHGFASDGQKPVKFEAALRLEQGGALSANGTAKIAGDEVDLRAKIERINLKPLQPALATRANVTLVSADASADVKLSYRKRGDKHSLHLGGSARVDNFLLNYAASNERLIAWKAVTATGLSLGLQPNQLKVEEARVLGLDAKIVVYKDRSTNIAKAVIVQQANAGAGKAELKTADTEALFPVTVARVRIEGGDVDFADLSLVLPFGTRVNQLAGVMEGISTNRQSRATLKVEGRVDEYGLARAEGGVKPFQPTDFMDIAVQFRNVDMPPLSPYSATFAGRRIASGKLSLDLKYKIDQGKLAGDNRVVLEKFTLGEKVDSPSALDLPLDLAVALLTDGDGKIDLTLPVSGDVNDPKFDTGAVIWQAVKIVLTKIVTAPFRALGALFGGGDGEKLEAISFDPGRAALLPPEQEKLKHVAEGLRKRPQLRLVAEGQTGPADRAALQQRDVALAVAAKLGRAAPAPGAAVDPVNVTDAKTQRALEAIFSERNPEDALAKFAADTGKARGKDVDRVNAALALVGRASADREFYEVLLKRLNETAKLPDSALPQLAEARAQAVASHLTSTLAIPAARAGMRVAKTAGEAQVKLELDVAK
ncbi:MAG: DUF748 domain-containing protein [Burkholderiales bacterium]